MFLIPKNCIGIYILPLFLIFSCVTNKNKSGGNSLSEAEKCQLIESYSWLNGHCVEKTSEEYKKWSCESKGTGSQWINESCINQSDLIGKREACLSANSQNVWQQDANGTFECLQPYAVVKNEASCFKLGKQYQWVHELCLPPDGVKCEAQGGSWDSSANNCLSKEQKNCEDQKDGSMWRDGKCMSGGALLCYNKGVGYKYVISGENEGACVEKSFADYCTEQLQLPISQVDKNIRQTIDSILSITGAASCQDAEKTILVGSSLDLSSNNIINLSPLSFFKTLKSLNLTHNSIVDISPLNTLTSLEILNLGQNNITEVSAILYLTHLKKLNLSFNKITDLSPMGKMRLIEELYLGSNNFNSLGPVGNYDVLEGYFGNLKILDISNNCGVADVSQLANLPMIQSLNLKNTGVAQDHIPQRFFGNYLNLSYSLCKNQ